jgi:hypothetical protein
MKTKQLLTVVVAGLMLAALTVTAGAQQAHVDKTVGSTTEKKPAKWEYGSLTFTSETNTWATGAESIHADDSEELLKKLGGKVARKQLTHIPALLDLLGQKGWELVQVDSHPGRATEAYFFKRPADTDK